MASLLIGKTSALLGRYISERGKISPSCITFCFPKKQRELAPSDQTCLIYGFDAYICVPMEQTL